MADHAKPRDHILGNNVYDVLKYTTEVILPGAAALYFALAQIWGLPAAEEVVGTIAAATVFLGLVLGYSRKSYNNSDAKFDGEIDVFENEDGVKQASLNLKNFEDPADVVTQDEVKFKVNKL